MPAFDDETAQTTDTTPRVADVSDLMFEARSKLALVHSASEHFEGEDKLGLSVNGARVMIRDIANTLEAIQSTLDRQSNDGTVRDAKPAAAVSAPRRALPCTAQLNLIDEVAKARDKLSFISDFVRDERECTEHTRNGAWAVCEEIFDTLADVHERLEIAMREPASGETRKLTASAAFRRTKDDLDAARRAAEAAKTDDETDAAQLIYRGLLDSFLAAPAADSDELAEKWRVIERELHDALFEGERAGTPELGWLAALRADSLRLARR